MSVRVECCLTACMTLKFYFPTAEISHAKRVMPAALSTYHWRHCRKTSETGQHSADQKIDRCLFINDENVSISLTLRVCTLSAIIWNVLMTTMLRLQKRRRFTNDRDFYQAAKPDHKRYEICSPMQQLLRAVLINALLAHQATVVMRTRTEIIKRGICAETELGCFAIPSIVDKDICKA